VKLVERHSRMGQMFAHAFDDRGRYVNAHGGDLLRRAVVMVKVRCKALNRLRVTVGREPILASCLLGDSSEPSHQHFESFEEWLTGRWTIAPRSQCAPVPVIDRGGARYTSPTCGPARQNPSCREDTSYGCCSSSKRLRRSAWYCHSAPTRI
jgi:hypothetical protein